MVKKEIDIKKKPTEEQQKMLREMEETSIIYDDGTCSVSKNIGYSQ